MVVGLLSFASFSMLGRLNELFFYQFFLFIYHNMRLMPWANIEFGEDEED